MALPTGTTSRQLQAVARWTLAGLVVLGMAAWWWPGYRGWGAAAGGLLAVLVLWLAWKTVAADRTVPGHPVHAAFLVPGAVLAVHFLQAQRLAGAEAGWAAAGALNASMLFHLALLSLGVMLSQSLLPAAARHVAVVGVAGAGMMGGPLAAIAWGQAEPVHTALAMLGFAGVAVWLSMLWAEPGGAAPAPPAGRLLRWGCLGIGAVVAARLAAAAPLQAVLAGGIVATALFMGGLVFPQRRAWLLLGAGAAAVGIAGVLAAVRWMRSALTGTVGPMLRASWWGEGEEAFRRVSAADSGLAVLAGTVGRAGTAAFVAALGACVVWLLLHAGGGSARTRARAVAWTAASGLVGGALLAPGGMFLPATLLAAALVWGLLPTMLGRADRRRSGAWLLGAVGAVLMAQAVAAEPGLLEWACALLGAGDKALHAITGFVLALLAAWLAGVRRLWLGGVGLALAAAAGLAGEVVQSFLSSRTAELGDWLGHLAGCVAAGGLYLLCIGARGCESPEARPVPQGPPGMAGP